ncbi:MAG: hypothetical protein WEB62_11845, partial [Bacteroidota bacterium]
AFFFPAPICRNGMLSFPFLGIFSPNEYPYQSIFPPHETFSGTRIADFDVVLPSSITARD